jgi:glycosyltransferase involved in cell wall biosynthesis
VKEQPVNEVIKDQRERIRVLVDVSFAAMQQASSAITGVGRVINAIVPRLAKMDRLSISVTGLRNYELNPKLTDFWVKNWADKTLGNHLSCKSSYRSITGISHIIPRSAFGFVNHSGGNKIISATAESPSGFMSRAVQAFARRDLRPCVAANECDIYFMTFYPPPPGLSESIPRIAFVHDVYPLRNANEAVPDSVGTIEAVIDELSPDRDLVITNSQYTKDDFCDLTGFPKERVVSTLLAADDVFVRKSKEDQDAVRKKYEIGTCSFFLTVANPQPRKNLETAIRAFKAFAEDNPSWKGMLLLIGNKSLGWGSESIEREIMQLGDLKYRVRPLGAVEDDDLPALYTGSVAFLFPSRFEGFGLPVLEAMQCGAPVISSNSTSLPEIGGFAPIYSDPNDPQGFADAMSEVFRNSVKRQSMIELGLCQARKFSWDRCAALVQDAIIRLSSKTISR